MQTNPKIYCIIPAYNEADSIIKVINDVKPFVTDIIVVDDNSSDNTYELAKKQGIIVLKHIINRGQGAALETGNEYARFVKADIVVHFDADGQFSAKEIPDILYPIIHENYDATLGSRFLNKSSNMPGFKKYVIMPLARLVNKYILNIKLTDPQNGFRALSSKTLYTIKITNDGSAHCSEILYKLFKNNLRVKEIPITVTYSIYGQGLFGGKGSGKGGFKIIKDLLLSKLIN